ncbi:hypothetical protein NE237_025284 [Protea cynaroides]|uniref:Uncharacterized protein n=1 Tax=Protea cynaroides TaxID=273540 RepID=A0A9Q0K1L7_9MAGN|nr:hypothetical protein NE237_025284 [Protea cynaroides]
MIRVIIPHDMPYIVIGSFPRRHNGAKDGCRGEVWTNRMLQARRGVGANLRQRMIDVRDMAGLLEVGIMDLNRVHSRVGPGGSDLWSCKGHKWQWPREQLAERNLTAQRNGKGLGTKNLLLVGMASKSALSLLETAISGGSFCSGFFLPSGTWFHFLPSRGLQLH